MATEKTPSQRGKSNRRKGHAAEQAVARYMRTFWPEACRAVRAGSSAAADPGDIANVPAVVSVKDCARENLGAWLMELYGMAADDPVALRLLVVKRRGHADPREWHCYLAINALAGLVRGVGIDGEYGAAPVRCDLDTVVSLMRERGYAS